MTPEERFNRIESILERVVDNKAKFDEALATTATVVGEIAQTQARTDRKLEALAEAQAKTDQLVRSLGAAVESLHLQWQAYLNTIRPQ